jgi:hypothetical protein
MAVVRFSDELKRTIRANAKDMFGGKLDKAGAAIPPSFVPSKIYELMFQDHFTKMDAMPDGYFKEASDFSISGIKGRGVPEDMDTRIFNLSMQVERRWPQTMDAAVHGLAKDVHGVYGTMYINANDPRWSADLIADYVAYCTTYNNIIESRDNFIAGVNVVVNTFSTLGPALKEWPALWDLLPTSTKERHKEIVERKKRVVLVSPSGNDENGVVDLDSLTAAVTFTKLTQ